MSASNIHPSDLTALRLAVGKELLISYNDMQVRAYQQVSSREWNSFSVASVIRLMIEQSIEAVTSAKYEELFTWVEEQASYGFETDVTQRILITLEREILAACTRVMPGPCALLAEIRVQFMRLEQIILGMRLGDQSAHAKHWKDPIDAIADEIIKSICRKDGATGEHSRAVSSWCRRIAIKLGLSEDLVTMVTRGGLIHDLGKLAVPNEILAAPRKLSDEEWPIMASHVTIGHQVIMSDYPMLQDLASMVRHHHERLDGLGYPDKLFADEIPLFTRIVTVADCYNAMVGRRPYRKAMSPEFAVQQIHDGRGKQFDPDVADAMIELVLAGRSSKFANP